MVKFEDNFYHTRGRRQGKPMLISLTPKEKKVLEFLELYISTHGYAPTFSEIKEHFHLASYNSVQKYLKQLQIKKYIYIPGDNQKRAITLLKPSRSVQDSVHQIQKDMSPGASFQGPFLKQTPTALSLLHPMQTMEALSPFEPPSAQEAPLNVASTQGPFMESLSLPLLGKVAAGTPIEALEHDTFVDVPSSMLKSPSNCFALKVCGESMQGEGICDGDIIFIQKQHTANKGELIVATIENEATVKRFYFHKNKNPPIELRPSNNTMSSLWYHPHQVKVVGLVVGLLRKY